MSKTSKIVTRALACVMAFALVVTSLTVTGTEAAAKKKAKIKSVKVTSPVTNGGKLVLKKGQKKRIKVKVTKTGKISKKVTYKSSNEKVAKIVKSKGKVYVKAVGKKNKTAKITIASKANKKKKATLKIKIGTPIKKVTVSKLKYTTSVTNNKEKDATKRTKTTNKTSKFSSKKGMVLNENSEDKANDSTISNKCTIKLKYSPTKVGYKGLKWKVKGKKVVYVSPKGVVTPIKVGSGKIVGYTKDGTNKKVTIKVKVNKVEDTVKVEPTPVPDTRKRTMVENFESYPVGTTWKMTKGEQYKNAKVATATVVKDPADAGNKVLKIAYDGNTQAYDAAPIFSTDLTKLKDCNSSTTLDNFVGVTFKTKVEGNSADVTYKGVYMYFAQNGTINENYYNATAQTQTTEYYKFKTSANMLDTAKADKDFTNPTTGKKDNNKNFPMYYSDYAKDKTQCMSGYSEKANDATLKLTDRTLDFKLSNMKDAVSGKSMLDLSKVDFTLGSTYSGNYPANNFVNLYLDDIQFLSNTVSKDVTAINVTNAPARLGKGISYLLKTALVPADTTQKKVKWESLTPDIATVTDGGTIKGLKAGTAKFRVSSVEKPAVKKDISVEIYETGTATEDKVIDLSRAVPFVEGSTAKVRSDVTTDYDEETGYVRLNFDSTNQTVVIDLGEEVDVTQYKSVEIAGKVAGQMSLELYDSSLDMDDEKWFEKNEGATYPFFGGSCGTRLEDGAYNTDALDMTYELLRYSFDDLTDDGTNEKKGMDFTKVRYVVLKSNQPPAHPIEYANAEGVSNYLIQSLKFSTKTAARDYLDVPLTSLNESMATSPEKVAENATYTSPVFGTETLADGSVVPFAQFTSNSKRTSGMAFYLDAITNPSQVVTGSGATVVEHDDKIDLSMYKYVKVKVTTDSMSDSLSLVTLADGTDWESREELKKETSVGKLERTIYFSIKEADDEYLSAIDAIGIKSNAKGTIIKIHSMSLVKGEPLIADADRETTFVVN